MRKMNLYVLMVLALGVLALPVEGVYHPLNRDKERLTDSSHDMNDLEEDDDYDISERDEIDGTDALAIPLDDSELEDEEEINRAEKREVFQLPSKH